MMKAKHDESRSLASGSLLIHEPVRHQYERFVEDCKRVGANLEVVLRADVRERLQVRWYESLSGGNPDFTIYNAEPYLAEAWGCWQEYSRKYLREMSRKLFAENPYAFASRSVSRIVDLGCGIGYTTSAFAQLFPDAIVCGTNIPGSMQYQMCKLMALRHQFEVVDGPQSVFGSVDLAFASDYFEHFPRPLDHLREVLAMRPRYLITANSFNTISPGHFRTYRVDGEPVPGEKLGRVFGKAMRTAGYEKLKTGFWNDRPSVWRWMQAAA